MIFRNVSSIKVTEDGSNVGASLVRMGNVTAKQ